jgi:hypothetical protein
MMESKKIMQYKPGQMCNKNAYRLFTPIIFCATLFGQGPSITPCDCPFDVDESCIGNLPPGKMSGELPGWAQ